MKLSTTKAGAVLLPSAYLTLKVSNEERSKAIEYIKRKNTEINFTGKSSGGLLSPNEIKKRKARDSNEMLIYFLEKVNDGNEIIWGPKQPRIKSKVELLIDEIKDKKQYS